MGKTKKLVRAIEKAVRYIYRSYDGAIPLHAPYFIGREWEYVKDCLDSGWVSYLGGYVDRFEEKMCAFTGSQYAVAAVNGTVALHMALLLTGVKPEDEVLCPAFSFVATVSAVIYCGACPVFVDSDPETLGMDPENVSRFLQERCIRKTDGFTYNRRTGRRISACIPMHTYGYPVEMASLMALCEEHGIGLVEDAAEALGSTYHSKHCGTMGIAGILSFNGNKIITTGGGGMILTNDGGLRDKMRHLTTTAKVDHPWEFRHDEVGYNFRMPNINAALGCAQLERLPDFLDRKTEQARQFSEMLRDVAGVTVIQPEIGTANHWFNLVQVAPAYRDDVLRGLNEAGIQARASWTPVCDMSPYAGYEKFEVETAHALFASMICLPNGLMK